MLDFLKNLTKSADDKRQEQLHAYVSDGLSPKERQQFERLLANDAELRAEVDGLRQMRQAMRQLPQRRAPRNFTLDPALYSKPKSQPLLQYYPAMRVATVMTAVFLMLAIGLEFVAQPNQQNIAFAPQAAQEAESVAMDTAVEDAGTDAFDDGEELMVEETVIEEVEVEQEAMAEEAMEEEAMDDEAMADSEMTETDSVNDVVEEEPVIEQTVAPLNQSQESGEEVGLTQPAEAPQATLEPDTPRIVATEVIGDRAAGEGSEDTVDIESPPVVLDETLLYSEEVPSSNTNMAATAVADRDSSAVATQPFFNPWRIAQIGLAVILLGLLMLLQAARMQR